MLIKLSTTVRFSLKMFKFNFDISPVLDIEYISLAPANSYIFCNLFKIYY